MLFYYIAEANEALIITGARAHSGKTGDIGGPEGGGFKIIVGKGVWVLPLFQKARRLGLQIHKTDVIVNCVTEQGIQVGIQGVVVYKVGDDFESISNAARRFLEREDEMDGNVHNVFAGHMRSIVGSMTVEEIIRNRDELSKQTRESSAIEMQKLGLSIQSLQIQELDDPTDYIGKLARPHTATVERDARIAEAEANQIATKREQEAAAANAEAAATSQIRQAELAATAQIAARKADQAGPLASAEAQINVVKKETEVSQLKAAQREQELQIEIVKPAQAARDATIAEAEAAQKQTVLAAEGAKQQTVLAAEAAKEQVVLHAEAEQQQVSLIAQAEAGSTKVRAEADAGAIRLRGQAEGEAIKAKLTAEADGLKSRAEALAVNQDAVIQQQIAEHLPQIVGEASKLFSGVDNLTVLNGAEGMGDMARQAIGFGLGLLPMVRDALGHNGDGSNHDKEPMAGGPAVEAPDENAS